MRLVRGLPLSVDQARHTRKRPPGGAFIAFSTDVCEPPRAFFPLAKVNWARPGNDFVLQKTPCCTKNPPSFPSRLCLEAVTDQAWTASRDFAFGCPGLLLPRPGSEHKGDHVHQRSNSLADWRTDDRSPPGRHQNCRRRLRARSTSGRPSIAKRARVGPRINPSRPELTAFSASSIANANHYPFPVALRKVFTDLCEKRIAASQQKVSIRLLK